MLPIKEKNNNIITDYCNELKSKGLYVITVAEAVKETGLSTSTIKGRKTLIKQNGIVLKIGNTTQTSTLEYVSTIRNYCKELNLKSINTITVQEAKDKTKLDIALIKNNKELFERYGIKLEFQEKIEEIDPSARIVRYCKMLNSNGIYTTTISDTEYKTGLNIKAIVKNRKLFVQNGIRLEVQESKKEVDYIIADYCEDIKSEGESYCRLHIATSHTNISKATILNKKHLFEQNGIRLDIERIKSSEEVVDIIKRHCKELTSNKIHTITVSEIERKIGLTNSTIRQRKNLFQELGVTLVIEENTLAKERREKITKYCKEIKSKGISSVTITDAVEATQLSASLIRSKDELFSQNKIELKLKYLPSREEIENILTKYINDLISLNIDNISLSEVASSTGISYKTLRSYEYIFEQNEIALKSKKSILEDTAVFKIETYCKNLKHNNTNSTEPSEIINELGISNKEIIKHMDIFERNGIIVNLEPSSNLEHSARQERIIKYCKSLSLKFNSSEAFNEFSKELLLLTTTIDTLENSDIYLEFSRLDIRKKLEEVILELNTLYDATDFFIMEIKYLLFKKSVFFDEETIIDILTNDMGINKGDLIKEKIEKRIRYSNILAKDSFEEVIYVDKLPDINNSENGNLIVLKKYKTKKKLLALWDKYCIFMIKSGFSGQPTKSSMININEWDEKLETLFEFHEGFKSICFKDQDCKDFLKFGYESLAAMALIAFNFINHHNAGGMSYRFQPIYRRITGFVMFLVIKGVILAHPKFSRITGGGGAKSVHAFTDFILEKHPIHKIHKDVVNNPNNPKKDISSLVKKNINVHIRKFATAINPKANLKKTDSYAIWQYVKSSEDYTTTISSTIKHSEYVFKLLRNYGNPNALKTPETLDIETYFSKQIAKNNISFSKKELYSELTSSFLSIINFQFISIKDKISPATVTQHIRAYVYLLSFLEQFEQKLTREQMIDALNPIIRDKNDPKNIYSWSEKIGKEKTYAGYAKTYLMLFNNMDVKNEYRGVYSKDWLISSSSEKTRTINREGMELAVYQTLQEVAFETPPVSSVYSLKRNAPSGEIIDLNWWTDIHGDTPIVPAICNWLISKLPRRMRHIRWLDVNQFIKYENGDFKGLMINTDKSRRNSNLLIPPSLVQIIFSNSELALLEKYVDYIKVAYSNLKPILYEGGGGYPPIQPLFPHHEDNNVISESTVAAMHNKCMLMTQFKIREKAKNGELDHYYGDTTLRDRKIEQFKTIELLVAKHKNFPLFKTIREMQKYDYTDNQYRVYFTTTQGVHNLRHAGASALYELGVPLFVIQKITGHLNLDVLSTIYLHESDDKINRIIATIHQKKSNFHERLDINMPASNANRFIKESIIPLVENDNPEDIYNELVENHFMSLERTVSNPNATIFGTTQKPKLLVDNGVEIASKFEPNMNWISKNEGICPVGGNCPDGTNCICCFCPLLIFSPLHIKGIEYNLQKSFLSFKFLERKMLEDQEKDSYSSEYEDLFRQYQLKLEEFYAWYEMIKLIIDRINSTDINTANSSGKANENSLALTETESDSKDEKINIMARQVTFNEQMMELLVSAKKLNIDNYDTDNYKARIANEIFHTAIANNDIWQAQELVQKGIEPIIEKYGAKKLEERSAFLLKYIGDIKSSMNNCELTYSTKLKS